ncbi:uncharacterized protein LOC120486630 isoform X2 [Pimephales promelas]|nr:uncharacterized protein LOC120486630 isoform X2 [Pimephales promelas]
MERDSVTLNTGVKLNRQENIRWYFNDTLIAHITGNLRYNCTDVQCNEGNERFRGRLKLDCYTGSLTIINIRNRHSGEYQLIIINGSDTGLIFNVSVHGVSAAERDKTRRRSVKGGECVTLNPGVNTNTSEVMTWYFKDIPIAEITGDQSQTCTDDQCEERFRVRLKLDHQTGSLIITNTTNTDSGLYKLQINNSRFSIIRSFCVCHCMDSSSVAGTGEL